jgi:subtilisin family serine protease
MSLKALEMTMRQLLGLMALCLTTFSAAAQQPGSNTTLPAPSSEQAALQAVREHLGTATGELTVVAVTNASFPELKRKVQEFKVRDARGRVHQVALDDALQSVDVQALAAAERAARMSRNGNLDEALSTKLEQFPSLPQRVIVWTVDRSSSHPSRPSFHGERLSTAEIDTNLARNAAARAADLDRQIAPVLERLHRVDPSARAIGSSPAIAMTANAEALRALARDPDIDRIYLDLNGAPETGEVAKETTGISSLALGGLLGDGVRIALTEAMGRAESASLLLGPILQDNANVCSAPDDHTTEVAGIVKGRRISIFGATVGLDGAAPNVELRVGGSCSTNSVELMDASSRAAGWGARVISMSWGLDTQLIPGGTDRFYDDIVFSLSRTVVKSSGNRGCSTPGFPASGPGSGETTSPGLGFNVLTIGGFDDHDTRTWSDDSVYVCSSFANPISTNHDREKPELSAPAVNLTVTAAGPANMATISGTSGASPLVASAVALMIESNGMLSMWPEIVRATLMATATHNIEGATRLSDIDGAGGLNAAAAVRVIGDEQRIGGRWYTCDDLSTPTPLALTSLTVGPRMRQRIVISWDTDPSYSSYPSQPSADIDLEVVDSNGQLVASSHSFDNTNEIVDFDTFLSDTFTLRAVKVRCDLPTWLGWAWQETPMTTFNPVERENILFPKRGR